jgi:hypothetical protein
LLICPDLPKRLRANCHMYLVLGHVRKAAELYHQSLEQWPEFQRPQEYVDSYEAANDIVEHVLQGFMDTGLIAQVDPWSWVELAISGETRAENKEAPKQAETEQPEPHHTTSKRAMSRQADSKQTEARQQREAQQATLDQILSDLTISTRTESSQARADPSSNTNTKLPGHTRGPQQTRPEKTDLNQLLPRETISNPTDLKQTETRQQVDANQAYAERIFSNLTMSLEAGFKQIGLLQAEQGFTFTTSRETTPKQTKTQQQAATEQISPDTMIPTQTAPEQTVPEQISPVETSMQTVPLQAEQESSPTPTTVQLSEQTELQQQASKQQIEPEQILPIDAYVQTDLLQGKQEPSTMTIEQRAEQVENSFEDTRFLVEIPTVPPPTVLSRTEAAGVSPDTEEAHYGWRKANATAWTEFFTRMNEFREIHGPDDSDLASTNKGKVAATYELFPSVRRQRTLERLEGTDSKVWDGRLTWVDGKPLPPPAIDKGLTGLAQAFDEYINEEMRREFRYPFYKELKEQRGILSAFEVANSQEQPSPTNSQSPASQNSSRPTFTARYAKPVGERSGSLSYRHDPSLKKLLEEMKQKADGEDLTQSKPAKGEEVTNKIPVTNPEECHAKKQSNAKRMLNFLHETMTLATATQSTKPIGTFKPATEPHKGSAPSTTPFASLTPLEQNKESMVDKLAKAGLGINELEALKTAVDRLAQGSLFGTKAATDGITKADLEGIGIKGLGDFKKTIHATLNMLKANASQIAKSGTMPTGDVSSSTILPTSVEPLSRLKQSKDNANSEWPVIQEVRARKNVSVQTVHVEGMKPVANGHETPESGTVPDKGATLLRLPVDRDSSPEIPLSEVRRRRQAAATRPVPLARLVPEFGLVKVEDALQVEQGFGAQSYRRSEDPAMRERRNQYEQVMADMKDLDARGVVIAGAEAAALIGSKPRPGDTTARSAEPRPKPRQVVEPVPRSGGPKSSPQPQRQDKAAGSKPEPGVRATGHQEPAVQPPQQEDVEDGSSEDKTEREGGDEPQDDCRPQPSKGHGNPTKKQKKKNGAKKGGRKDRRRAKKW